ncbi:GNAT family N-acetyltransferase [Streptomyces sp. NPDC088354]|uniref:GNAT family N-acetyltransferase n=1 Tax=Streptomyces sp. NPDC088354 TaxID=3365856 RepID=UPI0038053D7D
MYGADIFAAVADIPGAMLLAAEHDDALVGGFLCFHYRDVLNLWAAGIDYPRLRTLHTYTGLMLASVELAADLGATTIDAGRANYRYKRAAGLSPVALRTLAYFPDRDAATARALHTTGHGMEACAGLRRF